MNRNEAIDPPAQDPAQNSPAASASYPVVDTWQEEEIGLREYLDVLVESKWLIALVTAATLFLGTAYALIATPIYEADALIQIEEKESGLGGMSELTSLLTGSTPTMGEIEIMRSRSVLGDVVERLHLDIDVKPHHFPIIGSAWARLFGDEDEAVIDRLDVPEAMLEKQSFQLVTASGGRYQLMDEDGKLLLEGTVGKPASGHGVAIFISTIDAPAGTRFDIEKSSPIKVIQDLQKGLKADETGKETNIVRISYQNADPHLATEIIEHISEYYLRQNVERRSEEARKSLAFLDQQLPKVRQEVEASEFALKDFQEQHGAVDLQEESKALLEQLVAVQQLQSELEVKRSGLRQQFTEQHPVIAALDARSERLTHERQVLEAKMHQLPKAEQEALSLMRNMKVKNEVYTFLLNKAQELRVMQAGTIGNARIVDHAVAMPEPVKPKKALIVALSLVGGLFIGVLAAFVRKSLIQTVDDPTVLEQQLGLSVYAGIPHSDTQATIHQQMEQRRGSGHKQDATENLLAAASKGEGAVEALRSLRTNLHFAQMDAANNIVAISGPAPNLGKSFVTSNLAYVLADSGKQVLVIDGDLRKGHLQDYFAVPRSPGLAEAISEQVNWKQAVHATGIDNLSLLPTGKLAPNPSELLMHEHFGHILKEASSEYDFVLIDTPPVLAATDATVIAHYVGTFFLLLRAGKHPMREIQETLRHLKNGGIRVHGALLNDLQPKGGRYGYHYGNYYQYGYK